MSATNPRIWFDGHYVDAESAKCSVLEHGLHYGTGVFEGIRCYKTDNGPAIFRLSDHLMRLEQGARVLGMDVDIGALFDAACGVVAENGFDSAYIRPVSYYGGGSLHLDVAPLDVFNVVAAMPWTSHLSSQAVRLQRSPYRRNPARAIPALKLTGGYVNSILAKRHATLNGYDEALFVDDEGYVCEATGENVFAVFGDDVVAVSHQDALPGITRDTVIQLTGASTRKIHIVELMDADEVFLTGTSAEVVPVAGLNAQRFKVGPITTELQATYQDVVHGRHPRSSNWLTFVNEVVRPVRRSA
jgi:branched-chain amino acid aminotransferase